MRQEPEAGITGGGGHNAVIPDPVRCRKHGRARAPDAARAGRQKLAQELETYLTQLHSVERIDPAALRRAIAEVQARESDKAREAVRRR